MLRPEEKNLQTEGARGSLAEKKGKKESLEKRSFHQCKKSSEGLTTFKLDSGLSRVTTTP